MDHTDKMKEAAPPDKPTDEERTEELRQIVGEDIKEQRELIEKLRRKLNYGRLSGVSFILAFGRYPAQGYCRCFRPEWPV